MGNVDDCVVISDTFERANEFCPARDSVYIFRKSAEERSSHVDGLRSQPNCLFIEISDETTLDFQTAADTNRYSLRSSERLREFFRPLKGAQTMYLDITGFSHHVWAPLLKMALNEHSDIRVVYVEPDSYARNPVPVGAEIYDLSARITGLAPLPGFARLSAGSAEENFILVAFLGFEGARLLHVIENLQPSNEFFYPVVGCPGFKPEYVFETFLGNQKPLLATRAWQNYRLVAADCPFEAYHLLQDLASEKLKKQIRVAPIGTKPNALGAVLFCLSNSYRAELVYDHPIRKSGRTSGTSRLHVYFVSSFFASKQLATTITPSRTYRHR